MKKRKNKKGFLIGGIAAGAVVILAGGGILAWKLLKIRQHRRKR